MKRDRCSRLVYLSAFLVFASVCYPYALRAQDPAIRVIREAPSHEVYDLYTDSKGFLWLAHDQGISRFDGNRFVSFDHPLQNSVSTTDIAEDQQGRIWCHNFSGQIFYCDSLQLHLLHSYRWQEETYYPRIVICGDELVATSVKGVFVLNTKTFRSKYYLLPQGTTSLSMVGNRVVLRSSSKWFCYEKGKGVRPLSSNLRLSPNSATALQPRAHRDSFFLIVNPEGIYYTLQLQGDRIVTVSEKRTGGFINTISVDRDQPWIHTKLRSYPEGSGPVIDDLNLSDRVTDREGNVWMSSLKNGLCVQYHSGGIRKIATSFLSGSDFITHILPAGQALVMGTNDGQLFRTHTDGRVMNRWQIPQGSGGVEKIYAFENTKYLVAASVGLFLLDLATLTLRQVHPGLTVKDLSLLKDQLVLATASGIITFPISNLQKGSTLQKNAVGNKSLRTRSVAVIDTALFAAFSDGVYRMDGPDPVPLTYEGRPVFATCLRNVGGKLYIGTYNQGILVYDNKEVTSITTKNGLLSNSIRDIRPEGNSIWIFYHRTVQQWDPSVKALAPFMLPFSEEVQVSGLSEKDDSVYLATTDGLFAAPRKGQDQGAVPDAYIDRVLISGRPATTNQLRHQQNDIQFHISSPFYKESGELVYRYRLANGTDSLWQKGEPGQHVFRFISLRPGRYQFEIMAMDAMGKVSGRPAFYSFDILAAWYQSWWFRITGLLSVLLLLFFVVRSYFLRRLRFQKTEYEKLLAVQQERQRISSEIHDDIGAGLSGVRLLTEMTAQKIHDQDIGAEVHKIYDSLSELSLRMREVIWSLNTDNDSLDNLLHYLQRQSCQLFENSPIELQFILPEEVPEVEISGERRRHIYLAVKEALHNCLKHSDARTCRVEVRLQDHALQISVTDDGPGTPRKEPDGFGAGMASMQKRMKAVQGSFVRRQKNGTEIELMVPLKAKA